MRWFLGREHMAFLLVKLQHRTKPVLICVMFCSYWFFVCCPVFVCYVIDCMWLLHLMATNNLQLSLSKCVILSLLVCCGYKARLVTRYKIYVLLLRHFYRPDTIPDMQLTALKQWTAITPSSWLQNVIVFTVFQTIVSAAVGSTICWSPVFWFSICSTFP